jgi:hypothetical protein
VSSLKPVIHGHDHLEGGADPIPKTALKAGVLDPDFGMYDTSTTTVPTNTADQAAVWVHSSGAALLNLSTPDTPSIVAAGVYAITGTASFDTGWTPGASFPFGELIILGTPSTDFWFQSQQHGGLFSNFPPPVSFAATFEAEVGQQIQLTFSNFDGSTHVFSGEQIRVQRIFST